MTTCPYTRNIRGVKKDYRIDEIITLTVEVTTVTFKDTKGFCIFKFRLDDKQEPDVVHTVPEWVKKGIHAAKGYVGKVTKGDLLDLVCVVEMDRTHGRQFRVLQMERAVRADDRAVVAFLKAFPQVGPKRAVEIVQHFGGIDGVLTAFETAPARLAEIKGITKVRAEDIAKEYTRQVGRRDALMFCRGLELPGLLSARIMDAWEGKARTIITTNPYSLMSLYGVTFNGSNKSFSADEIAREKFNVGIDDPRRVAAAAVHVITAVESDGHSFCTLAWLQDQYKWQQGGANMSTRKALREIDMPKALLEQGFKVATLEQNMGVCIMPPMVVIEEDRLYPAAVYHAEVALAADIQRLLAG